jgi:uncharacterized protein YutE (UPF0331/DUF86 family)
MKINRDVVIMRFEYLNKLLKELEDVKNIGNEDFKNNFSTILKTERALVLSTNICIDIGAHILAINDINRPETYGEIFEDLMKEKVISRAVKDKMIEFVGLRNLLGHLYTKIDYNKLYVIVQEDLNVFYSYRDHILEKFKDQLKENND